MTPEQFDSATEQRRNEAVARALGWIVSGPPNRGWWNPPNDNSPDATVDGPCLPNFSGSDDVAFEMVLPELVKLLGAVMLIVSYLMRNNKTWRSHASIGRVWNEQIGALSLQGAAVVERRI